MSLTREQARRNLIETARSDARRHGIPILLAVADALDEAEATITGLREALADLFARADATPLETPVGIFFAASREAMAARARARPEFPDTERG